jgi:anti-sigma B factor antagonist
MYEREEVVRMLEQREAADGSTVIGVHGDLDFDSHVDLELALVQALDAGAGPIVVDLAEVPFLDSSGVRVLLSTRERAQTRNTSVTVRNPQPVVERVLRLTGVAEMLGLPEL